MSIKQILDKFLNKKWRYSDLIWLIFSIVIASIFITPLLGIPIGVAVYFLLFNISDETKEHAFMPRKFIDRWEEPLTKLVDECRYSVSY